MKKFVKFELSIYENDSFLAVLSSWR